MRGCRGEVPPSLEALGKGEGCALWVVAGSDTEWAVGTDGHPECLRGVSPAASSSNRRGAASRTFAEPGGAVCVRWPLPRGGDSCRPDPCCGEGGGCHTCPGRRSLARPPPTGWAGEAAGEDVKVTPGSFTNSWANPPPPQLGARGVALAPWAVDRRRLHLHAHLHAVQLRTDA